MSSERVPRQGDEQCVGRDNAGPVDDRNYGCDEYARGLMALSIHTSGVD